MPQRPARPCKVPTCPELTLHESGYCDEHADKRKDYDRDRGTAAHRGYDKAWKRKRDRYIRKHPLCEQCGQPAKMVDHMVPKTEGGGDEEDNLQSLCYSCHSIKTKRERAERAYRALR